MATAIRIYRGVAARAGKNAAGDRVVRAEGACLRWIEKTLAETAGSVIELTIRKIGMTSRVKGQRVLTGWLVQRLVR